MYGCHFEGVNSSASIGGRELCIVRSVGKSYFGKSLDDASSRYTASQCLPVKQAESRWICSFIR